MQLDRNSWRNVWDLGQRPPTSLVTGANPCVPANAHVLEAREQIGRITQLFVCRNTVSRNVHPLLWSAEQTPL